MNLNPDLLLQAPECADFLAGVKERLDLALLHGGALSVVGFRIEDRAGTGFLPSDVQERLLARAQTLIKRSVRMENDARRRITDAVYPVAGMFFVVLFNADERSYLIPVGRIIENLRQEVYHTGSMSGSTYTRTVILGGYTWLPSHGSMPAEAVLGQVLEACVMASITPHADPCGRLGINPSPFDELKLYEYPWAPPRRKAPRPLPAPAAEAPALRREPLKKPRPRPPWWQFWHRR